MVFRLGPVGSSGSPGTIRRSAALRAAEPANWYQRRFSHIGNAQNHGSDPSETDALRSRAAFFSSSRRSATRGISAIWRRFPASMGIASTPARGNSDPSIGDGIIRQIAFHHQEIRHGVHQTIDQGVPAGLGEGAHPTVPAPRPPFLYPFFYLPAGLGHMAGKPLDRVMISSPVTTASEIRQRPKDEVRPTHHPFDRHRPISRLSLLFPRLSPMTKRCPSGTFVGQVGSRSSRFYVRFGYSSFIARYPAVPHLYDVARKTDHPLDVIPVFLLIIEYDHFAALRFAEFVHQFVDQHPVTVMKRLPHRRSGNVKRFAHKKADDPRQDEGDNQGLHPFPRLISAFFACWRNGRTYGSIEALLDFSTSQFSWFHNVQKGLNFKPFFPARISGALL